MSSARAYQRLYRFVGAETLDELGVCVPEFGAEGIRRMSGCREPLGQLREPQPRSTARSRGVGRLDVLVE